METEIGPLGAGCIHCFPDAQNGRFVGVERLPPVDSDSLGLPSPFCLLMETCRGGNYRQVQACDEETGLGEGYFTVAACYNVLDYCRNPRTVLSEIYRILKPDGHLLLGFDIVSSLSLLRFHHYVKRVCSQTICVRAHPFHFEAAELENLVGETGFVLLTVNRRSYERVRRLLGRAHRLPIVGRKRTSDGEKHAFEKAGKRSLGLDRPHF